MVLNNEPFVYAYKSIRIVGLMVQALLELIQYIRTKILGNVIVFCWTRSVYAPFASACPRIIGSQTGKVEKNFVSSLPFQQTNRKWKEINRTMSLSLRCSFSCLIFILFGLCALWPSTSLIYVLLLLLLALCDCSWRCRCCSGCRFWLQPAGARGGRQSVLLVQPCVSGASRCGCNAIQRFLLRFSCRPSRREENFILGMCNTLVPFYAY